MMYGRHQKVTLTSFIKVSTIIAEEVKNYTAMIVQKDNPQLNNIIKDFDEFVGFFQNKPQ